MAIYPKKSKDPTEVALSAIQDALNVRDPDTGFCFYLCDECINNEVLV